MGIIKSGGVDKDELVAVFFMTQDPMRGDFVGDGFQTTTRSFVLSSESVDDLLRTISWHPAIKRNKPTRLLPHPVGPIKLEMLVRLRLAHFSEVLTQ